jgi:N-acetyl-anhydromuramyl-L-alanine amidase AmpD
MPLRDAAAFVQKEYPAAGYRIVGGDAETHEADIIWAHGRRSGKTRLSGTTDCSTTWTVAALAPGEHTSEPDQH